jgi:DNA-binding transcriptional ArsR family regulator
VAGDILCAVQAFDVLGDPVRRRILELLADGEQSAGAVSGVIRAEFGISQPAVSQHLRVLRESGSRPSARTAPAACTPSTRRHYGAPLREVNIWLKRFRRFWSQHLDALGTELARGRRERRHQRNKPAGTPSAGGRPSTKSEEDT